MAQGPSKQWVRIVGDDGATVTVRSERGRVVLLTGDPKTHQLLSEILLELREMNQLLKLKGQ